MLLKILDTMKERWIPKRMWMKKAMFKDVRENQITDWRQVTEPVREWKQVRQLLV